MQNHKRQSGSFLIIFDCHASALLVIAPCIGIFAMALTIMTASFESPNTNGESPNANGESTIEEKLEKANKEIDEKIPAFRNKLHSHAEKVARDMRGASSRAKRTLNNELYDIAGHLEGLDIYEEEMIITRTELRAAYRAEQRKKAGLPTVDIDVDEIQEIHTRAEAKLGQQLGSPEGTSAIDDAEVESRVRELMESAR